MKNFFIFLISILLTSNVAAQNLIVSINTTISVSASYLNVTINSGAVLTINPGVVLSISRDLTVNSGSITLGSGAILRFNGTNSSQTQFITGSAASLVINGVDGIVESANAAIPPVTIAIPVHLYGVFAPVTGETNFSGSGSLTLKATSPTQYARLALNNGGPIATRTVYTGTITGNVTMEHTFQTTLQSSAPTPPPSQYNGDWFQISYPLQVADLSSGWTGLTVNTTGAASTQNFYWYNSASSGVNTDAGLNLSTPAVIDDALGWQMAVSGDNHTKPYTVFLTNDAPFQVSQTVSLTGAVNLADVDFTSELNLTSDPWQPGGSPGRPVQSPTSENHVGWNLLRNPWPTNIDTESWFSFQAGGGAAGAQDDWDLQYIAVHVWNSITGQYQGWTNSDFATPTFSTIDYNTAGGVAVGGTAAAQNIPPFQAFWVKTSAASIAGGGKVRLKKRYTETAFGAQVFQKTTSTLPETAVLFAFDQDSLKDISLVYYNTGLTNQFDYQGDIFKLGTIKPGVPSLYIEEGGNYAQSAGRPFAPADTIEVFYESSKNNTTAYLWLNDTNITSAYSVTLVDKLLSTTQDMRANPSYQFTHNTNNDPNRFQLVINNSAFDVTDYHPSVKPMNVYTTGNELAIESVDYSGRAYVTMLDMAGRIILSREIIVNEGVTNFVQMQGLAAAIYSVQIEFDGRVMVEKIMK